MAEISSRSRLVTVLLTFFLGIFGVHRFYIGKTRMATVMLHPEYLVPGDGAVLGNCDYIPGSGGALGIHRPYIGCLWNYERQRG